MAAESGSFGAALREHRARRGLTQQAVAELADVSVRTVRALEQGHTREPEPQTAVRLAGAVRMLWPPFELPKLVRPPAQLPMDARGFVGRQGQLSALDDASGGPVVITGTAGVGKTSLAVRWAHRVRSRFPDGQLYADLRGYTWGRPLRATEVAARFLRAFGLPPEQVPPSPEQAVVLYQALLADRKMLVLLDNVADVEQVRDLVPDHPTSLAVITSRDQLHDLSAARLDLDVMSSGEAGELLSSTLGESRVDAEPVAAQELVSLCGSLPLALRVAAAHLADQPGQPLSAHVESLRSGNLLTHLAVDDDPHAAVRAAFDLSYHRLSTADKHLFRMLGLVPGEDFTADLASFLTGSSAADGLHRLVSAHLVQERAPGRYGFHDLLRLYAAELAESEDPSALYDWYLAHADAVVRTHSPEALRLPVPPLPPVQAGPDWLDPELGNLTSAVTDCRSSDMHERAWLIADTLRTHYWMSGNGLMWTAAASAALRFAAEAGDLRAQAAAHFSLSGAYTRLNSYALALEHGSAAVGLGQRTGWQELEAASLGMMTALWYEVGQLSSAEECGRRAVALGESVGARNIVANSLVNLGNVFLDSGDPEQALVHYRRAHELASSMGVAYVAALALAAVGTAHREAGRPAEAHRCLTSAMDTMRELGDTAYGGRGLFHFAEVQLDLGDLDGALASARQAVELAPLGGDHTAEADAHRVLGTVLAALGDDAGSAEHFKRALVLAGGSRSRFCEAKALIGLGRYAEALEIAQAHGFHGLIAQCR
ncbi:hypothetical protein Lesp02_43080 [Lentzea sp. NBRC 105346]|uniref:ATP-binding protein n=1 Tax=Lentzea sp. NBRC 105346 TaxID=3032205 RepID=UPI0024A38533|nr:helix-turn-helix domain-containing protein [Lentzea sp. NBRC 105346]GLZ32120.1 hypothetical protein Lesp02_43080 [Lentzea sp. NBRC 105346]